MSSAPVIIPVILRQFSGSGDSCVDDTDIIITIGESNKRTTRLGTLRMADMTSTHSVDVGVLRDQHPHQLRHVDPRNTRDEQVSSKDD